MSFLDKELNKIRDFFKSIDLKKSLVISMAPETYRLLQVIYQDANDEMPLIVSFRSLPIRINRLLADKSIENIHIIDTARNHEDINIICRDTRNLLERNGKICTYTTLYYLIYDKEANEGDAIDFRNKIAVTLAAFNRGMELCYPLVSFKYDTVKENIFQQVYDTLSFDSKYMVDTMGYKMLSFLSHGGTNLTEDKLHVFIDQEKQIIRFQPIYTVVIPNKQEILKTLFENSYLSDLWRKLCSYAFYNDDYKVGFNAMATLVRIANYFFAYNRFREEFDSIERELGSNGIILYEETIDTNELVYLMGDDITVSEYMHQIEIWRGMGFLPHPYIVEESEIRLADSFAISTGYENKARIDDKIITEAYIQKTSFLYTALSVAFYYPQKFTDYTITELLRVISVNRIFQDIDILQLQQWLDKQVNLGTVTASYKIRNENWLKVYTLGGNEMFYPGQIGRVALSLLRKSLGMFGTDTLPESVFSSALAWSIESFRDKTFLDLDCKLFVDAHERRLYCNDIWGNRIDVVNLLVSMDFLELRDKEKGVAVSGNLLKKDSARYMGLEETKATSLIGLFGKCIEPFRKYPWSLQRNIFNLLYFPYDKMDDAMEEVNKARISLIEVVNYLMDQGPCVVNKELADKLTFVADILKKYLIIWGYFESSLKSSKTEDARNNSSLLLKVQLPVQRLNLIHRIVIFRYLYRNDEMLKALLDSEGLDHYFDGVAVYDMHDIIVSYGLTAGKHIVWTNDSEYKCLALTLSYLEGMEL